MAGARIDVAIHYLVPRIETGRFTFGARGGLLRNDNQTNPAWDAAFGMHAGDSWTFGWEMGVTSWRSQLEMETRSAWFFRMGLLLGTRL